MDRLSTRGLKREVLSGQNYYDQFANRRGPKEPMEEESVEGREVREDERKEGSTSVAFGKEPESFGGEALTFRTRPIKAG